MTKLMLTKKSEISVTEEKKGKQIAVKENNIISLKQFYQTHYSTPVVPTNIIPPVSPIPQESVVAPTSQTPLVMPEQTINTVESSPIVPGINQMTNTAVGNNLAEQTPIMTSPINPIPTPQPVVPPSVAPTNNLINEPIIQQNSQNISEAIPVMSMMPKENNMFPQSDITSDDSTTSNAIKLTPETTIIPESLEELDPELKEIKARLDQVIMDLNNYKKKIKILENEVNQNLEKSREVLKDTQAAAKIMSIQQERQRQITEEINGSTPTNDSSRLLQKDAI